MSLLETRRNAVGTRLKLNTPLILEWIRRLYSIYVEVGFVDSSVISVSTMSLVHLWRVARRSFNVAFVAC
jgi:hypothetical protein